MTREELEKERKRRIIPALRRVSRFWKPKQLASVLAKNCASCGVLFTKDEKKQMDHIEAVVNVKTGFNGWAEYIERMFCNISGYQALCLSCHKAKTSIERELRKKYRAKNKKIKK